MSRNREDGYTIEPEITDWNAILEQKVKQATLSQRKKFIAELDKIRDVADIVNLIFKYKKELENE